MNAKDIRQYLLMAADKIERFPTQFRFIVTNVPADRSGCGCALGWIGYFAGMNQGLTFVETVSQSVFGVDGSVFYRRMNALHGRPKTFIDWTVDAAVCADTLRRYADEYYPNQAAADDEPSDAAVEASITAHLLGVTE